MDPIERYILGLRGLNRRRGELMHWLVTALFPDAEQGMQYRMPTYRSGRHFVAWGSRGDCILLLTASEQRIAEFRKRHPGVSATGGSLSFRLSDPFPVDELALVVRNALAPKPARDKTANPARRGPRRPRRSPR